MNLMFVIILSVATLCAVILISARLLTRADQRRRARSEFAGYMEAVFIWSENRDDLSMAQTAMEAVDTHKLLIHQARRVSEKDLYISRARRDYLEEYTRLQHRHNELLKRSKSRSRREVARKDKTYLMAIRFQEAAISLAGGSQSRAN